MAAKKKIGIRIPSINEINKKYGDMIVTASETKESGLWLPSTFFALNYTFGGGIPFGKILEVAGEEWRNIKFTSYHDAWNIQIRRS